MTRPIPVFSFVFAAYAATSKTAVDPGRPALLRTLQPCDPFLTAWRVRSTQSGALLAKVGLLTGATADHLSLAVQNSRDAHADICLDEIVETRLGFIGAVMPGQSLPSCIKSGDRLRFHGINVLDWRLGNCQTPCPHPQRECVKRHPREMLAELTEIVGT